MSSPKSNARLVALQALYQWQITGQNLNEICKQFEEDWNAISETLNLLSVPGMRESIQEGLKQDLSESSKELDW